jgi:hypothetical protein
MLSSMHTPNMTLKNAAFLALIGMILVAIMQVAIFIRDVRTAMQGLIPADVLLGASIYAFGGLTLTVFLYAFYKAQR